jgi:hypothetical protein
VGGGYIQPVCPLVFKDEVHMDVCAFDQPGSQSHTALETGETVIASEGNELLAGVISVICIPTAGTVCLGQDHAFLIELLLQYSKLAFLEVR